MQRFEPLPDRAWFRRVRVWGAWTERRHAFPAPPDVVARFAPLLVALRWGTLSLAVALGVVEKTGRHVILVGFVLALYTFWRTLWPIRYDQVGWQVPAALCLEVALSVAVIEATGYGRSPFLVCLVVATAIVGFAGGIRIVSWLSVLAGLAVALPSVILVHHQGVVGSSFQYAIEVVLVGVVGGFSRIVIEDARQAREGLTAQAEHLSEVNDLLLDLHRATAREPTPLDLEGAARWALERLDEMFSPGRGRRGSLDPVTGLWHLVAGKGVRVTGSETSMELPQGTGDGVRRHRAHRPRRPRARTELPVAVGPLLSPPGPRRAGGHVGRGVERIPPCHRRRPTPHRRSGPGRGPRPRQRPVARAHPRPGGGAGAVAPGA